MAFPVAITAGDLLPFYREEVARLVSETPSSSRPVFLHMMGVPGAGKSRFVHRLLPHLPSDILYTDFDKMMVVLPDYQAAVDKAQAFHTFEKPARDASFLLLNQLVEKKASLFLDHGASVTRNLEMLRYARDQKGYRIVMMHVRASLETAKARAARRAAEGGRYTPMNMIEERFDRIQGLAPLYREVAHAFFEVENEADSEAMPHFDAVIHQVVDYLKSIAAQQETNVA